MKEYEGLFILDTEDSATGVDGIIRDVGALIGKAGGFYVSLIFEMEPSQLKDFNTVLAKRPEVFRAQITYAPAEPVAD